MHHLLLIPVFFAFVYMLFMALTSGSNFIDKNLQKVEQGSMSIVTYHDHTYIVWSINMGGGIVHDPDCECFK